MNKLKKLVVNNKKNPIYITLAIAFTLLGSYLIYNTFAATTLGLKATKQSDSAVLVSWNSIDNATSYRVGRDGTDSNGNGPWSTTDPGSATSRVFDRLLLNEQTYTFSVQALNSSGSVITSATISCCNSTNTGSPADINQDNVVDIVDLSMLLSDWGKNYTRGDVNKDGTVDIIDLSILITAWGPVQSPPPPDPDPDPDPGPTPDPTPPPSGGADQLLKVSANKRYLVKEDGSQFFWIGDTAWTMAHAVSREKVDRYLSIRAGQKFNIIQMVGAPRHKENLANVYGQKPRFGAITDANPNINGKYWDHVEYIIDKAAQNGLYVALVPEWPDQDFNIINENNCDAFAKYLADRFKSKKNLIWMLGGDRDVNNSRMQSYITCMANTIKSRGAPQMISVHPKGYQTSRDGFNSATWLDFSNYQSSHLGPHNSGTYDLAKKDWNRTPTKPTLNSEACYEGHPINFDKSQGWFDSYDTRRHGYHSIFAGAFGYTYGHELIWRSSGEMGIGNQSPYNYNWDDDRALKSMGAQSMTHLKSLMDSRPMNNLAPDNSVITSGTKTGIQYTSALRSTDGNYFMVYLPTGGSVTVDLNKLSGTQVKAWWYNPKTGAASNIGTFAKNGTRSFSASSSGDNNDWILVIDDASRGYSAPGA